VGAYECTCPTGKFYTAGGCAQLELSYATSYLIKGNGELWGWGANYNQLLTAATEFVEVPTRIGTDTFADISVPYYTA